MSALEVDVAGTLGALSLAAAFTTTDAPLVVVGPNGAGKTTVLMMILGAVTPARGRIALAGAPSSTPPRASTSRSRPAASLPARSGTPSSRTSTRSTTSPTGSRRGRATSASTSRARRSPRLDVAALAQRRPAGALGRRSAAGRPRPRPRAPPTCALALVLDEPMAALDVTVRRDVRRFLAERLRAWRLPTVVVTHDPADAEALDGDVLVMERGAVTQAGRLADLSRDPRTGLRATVRRGRRAPLSPPLRPRARSRRMSGA